MLKHLILHYLFILLLFFSLSEVVSPLLKKLALFVVIVQTANSLSDANRYIVSYYSRLMNNII